jgi:predicted permease
MESFLQDVGYGLRTMWRSPVLTAVAVLSLALGIGANTAIFSLLDAVILRTLPVHDPERLVLFGKGESQGITISFPDQSWDLFSYPFYRDIQQKNEVFSGVAAMQSMPNRVHATIDGGNDPEPVDAREVSGTYFSVLGVNAGAGRVFTDADDQVAGGHPVAVASFSWWKRQFGGQPFVGGKTLTIGATIYTIIGVAPAEFFGTTVGESPDVWIPLSMEEQVPPGWKGLHNNLFQSLYLIGRLKPGLSMSEAAANVNLLYKQLLHEYAGAQPSQKQLAALEHARIELTPAATGLSQLRMQFSQPLRVLMGVAGLVLLIACANIANLLLARATARAHEIAVRMAIGAGRMRLIRQLLTESFLLAMTGGSLGVAFAWWSSRILVGMVSTGQQPLPLKVSPDLHVLTFTLLVCLATALLSGTAPALRATRVELVPSLKDKRGSVSGMQRSSLAKGLIIAQVALSFALLVGAGLFVRSLVKLANVDPGFNQDEALLFNIDMGGLGYKETDPRLPELCRQVEQRVSALPGVRAASFSLFTFNEGDWTVGASVQGYVPSSDQDRVILNNSVGEEFFRSMGLPILAGRGFSAGDTSHSAKVAVINETMARRFFPGRSPIGEHFGLGAAEHSNDIEIVGIVKDAKYDSLDEKPQAAAYYPFSQSPQLFNDFIVRYSGDARTITDEVRRAISDVNPTLAVWGVSTMAEQVQQSVLQQRLIAQLSAFFGLLALLLACIGLYGVMSYTVTRRTSELGIRMALGAERKNVLWLVMRETLLLIGTGLAIGMPLAMLGTRLVSNMLFGLVPSDPATIACSLAVLLTVAALAGYLPARRASMVDPMVALRYE